MKKLLPFILICSFQITTAQTSSLDNFDNPTLTSEVITDISSDKIQLNTTTHSPTVKNIAPFNSMILKDRLAKLNENTPFNVPYNATVERFIRLNLKTKKESISNLMDRADFYFPIFEEHLDKFDIPLEIKYLAVIESALLPTATSHAGAKGIWQFMYHTGKAYGLNVSSYIDERTDPLKATEAACKYLKHLYKTFGDWDLALAAYNSGPGNVNKAIRRSGGKRNYWNIRQYLPKETSSYVPAFYAMFYLFEYGEAHQIYPSNIEIDYFDTDTIHINQKLSFLQIEKTTGLSYDFIKSLNPQYKLGIIPFHKGKTFVLTLPKNSIDSFLMNDFSANNIKSNEQLQHIIPTIENSYVVQQLDNLPKIARKFNISLNQLKGWNGLQTDYLIEGQRLVVTDRKSENYLTIKTKKATLVNNTTNQAKANKTYTVKEGDSLFIISKKFPNTTINQLRNWNNLWGVSYVKPGTSLKILTATK